MVVPLSRGPLFRGEKKGGLRIFTQEVSMFFQIQHGEESEVKLPTKLFFFFKAALTKRGSRRSPVRKKNWECQFIVTTQLSNLRCPRVYEFIDCLLGLTH